MDKLVILTVHRGIHTAHTIPKGIKVQIVDFDCTEEWPERTMKFEGRDAVISEYTHLET